MIISIKKFIDRLLPSRKWKITAILLLGVIGGLGALTVYESRMHSYMSDDPATCVNCHIMGPFYATWQHSSHGRITVCNDCHVPHDNVFREYYFHAKDGMRHSAVFTLRGEPQAFQAIEESQQVIMENCIRCHTQLNTEFVKTGTQSFDMIKNNKGKACWDCHRDVPHGGKNSLTSTPNALVPYPTSELPEWLNKALKKPKQKVSQ